MKTQYLGIEQIAHQANNIIFWLVKVISIA